MLSARPDLTTFSLSVITISLFVSTVAIQTTNRRAIISICRATALHGIEETELLTAPSVHTNGAIAIFGILMSSNSWKLRHLQDP